MSENPVLAGLRLAEELSEKLAGRGPAVQGPTLVALVARYIAGHDPEIRQEVLDVFTEHVRVLVEMEAQDMVKKGRAPAGWGGKQGAN